MDIRTWWPGQSRTARDLCAQMTGAERWGLCVLQILFGAWIAYTIVWPIIRFLAQPSLSTAAGIFFMFGFFCCGAFLYYCILKCYIMLTKPGRSLNYQAERLELFSIEAVDSAQRT